MAKPIKLTPILKGKDAINFFIRLSDNKDKKVDVSVMNSIKESANKLKSILVK